MEKTYILILNWNGWRDTVECLESVFRSEYADYRVIVCDNGSEDGSLERIKAWADGKEAAPQARVAKLAELTMPPVPKPIKYSEYTRVQAEEGGAPGGEVSRLVLISNGANLGFAGGNNVGLRYASARNDFDYIWLLNNDTVVHRGALAALARKMQKTPGAGICGSTVVYYDEPGKIWALGGVAFNKWLSLPNHLGHGQPAGDPVDEVRIERSMDYVAGASMFVSKAFLTDIGLMEESYFLYFEELDWAQRATGRYCLAYAPDSLVYHKVGASTAAHKTTPGDNLVFNFRVFRNRLLVSLRFFPLTLPTVLVTGLYRFVKQSAASCLLYAARRWVKPFMRKERGQ